MSAMYDAAHELNMARCKALGRLMAVADSATALLLLDRPGDLVAQQLREQCLSTQSEYKRRRDECEGLMFPVCAVPVNPVSQNEGGE